MFADKRLNLLFAAAIGIAVAGALMDKRSGDDNGNDEKLRQSCTEFDGIVSDYYNIVVRGAQVHLQLYAQEELSAVEALRALNDLSLEATGDGLRMANTIGACVDMGFLDDGAFDRLESNYQRAGKALDDARDAIINDAEQKLVPGIRI